MNNCMPKKIPHKLPKLTQEEKENVNRALTRDGVSNQPPNKVLKYMVLTSELYQTFIEKLSPILLKPSPQTEENEILPNSFYETSTDLIPKPSLRIENHRAISLSMILKFSKKY